jgi:acetylornithine deacetylase/succinyl-diaminopimelate desuccinylase-like protein
VAAAAEQAAAVFILTAKDPYMGGPGERQRQRHRAEAVAFGTDAPYLQQLGCQTIVLGPGDIACAHQPGEYLEMSRIEPTVRLLRDLIRHYCLN